MKEIVSRRVVITGLGIVAPHGVGQQAFWNATRVGTSSITRISDTDTVLASKQIMPSIQVAGVVQDFASTLFLDRKLVQRTDRMTHFALAALQEALDDARLQPDQEEPERMGAVIANTVGGVNYVLQQLEALYTRGPRAMSAYTAIAWLHVANIGQAAIRHNLRSYCKTPVNDTAGGLDALGTAYRAIRRGAADILFAGGSEAMLNPFILHILARQGQFVTDDDIHAYRPFDRRANGLVIAEGAGICVLEEYEHARQRNAPIYGEIVGFGQTNDASGLQPPSSDGRRYALAFEQALQAGSIAPHEVAYVSLDGRAWQDSDRGEAQALQRVFGSHLPHIALSVPRTSMGHSYAAAGALDTITTLLALRHAQVPPTINCEELDPHYEISLVRDHAQTLPTMPDAPRTALIGGRGSGGTNMVLAIKRDAEGNA